MRRKLNLIRRSATRALVALVTATVALVSMAEPASAVTVIVNASGPSSANVGSSFSITINYSCSGNEDCENVTISVSTSGSLSGGGSCNLGTVSTGSSSSCAVSVSFPASAPNGAQGHATATSSLSNGSGHSDQHTVTAVNSGGSTTTTSSSTTTTSTTTTTTQPPAPEVWIDKYSSGGGQYPGDNFTYYFRIRNIGDYPLHSLALTDELPDIFSYGSASASHGGVPGLTGNTLTITWPGALGVGQEITASIPVTVTYPDPSGNAYSLHHSVSNCATLTGTSSHGNVTDSDCTWTTIYDPLDGSKYGSSSSVGVGDTVEYTLSTRNRGHVPVEDVVLLDEFPVEWAPQQLYTGSWSPSAHQATFEYRVGGVWSPIGTFDGSGGAWYTLPAGVNAVRVDYGDLPDSFSHTSSIRVEAEAINPDRDGNYYSTPRNTANCAFWTSANFDGDSSCKNVQIFQPAARPLPSKIAEIDHQGPMDEVSFVLTMRNSSGAQLPLIDPFLIDHLPYQLEFVSWEPITAGTAPTFTQTDDFGSAGRTRLRWDFAETFTPGQYYSVRVTARIRSGTPQGQYVNQSIVSTNDTTHYVECASSAVPDLADVDGDGNTSEWLCVGTSYFNVVRKVLTEARMVVRGEDDLPFLDATTLEEDPGGACPDFDGYTYYPCVAQTRSLGNTDYLLEIENQGNVSLTDFALYNTLPYIGDTGVWEGTLTSQRESEWRPTLAAALTVHEAPPGSNVVIEYSFSQNPCRPEMSIAGNPPGTAWPTSCVDDWGPAPTDIEDLRAVQSVRIAGEFVIGDAFDGGERIVIGYDLDAAHGSPFGQEIAWTTFAYTSTQVDTGARNLPAEPRKTGMVIKQPDNGIGDYVWLDLDRNGVQDIGEPGLNGIAVQLFGYDGNGDPELVRETTTSFLQADTSKPGYYFFGDLEPGTYFVAFEPPRLGWNAMLPGLGDDAVDSDASAITMITPDIVIGEHEIVLDIDQGYFIPGGPYHCPEGDTGPMWAGGDSRRHENDPRPCPA